MDRLEKKLEEHPGQLMRACVELAKAWRTDKYLRRLEVIFCSNENLNGVLNLFTFTFTL